MTYSTKSYFLQPHMDWLIMAADDIKHGEYKVPGGKLVVVDFATVDGLLADVQVSGDFFLEPASALDVIDAALEGLPVESDQEVLAAAVRVALGPKPKLFGFTPEAIGVAVRRALNPTRTGPDDGDVP